MGQISFKVRIPYDDIATLRSDLRSDQKLNAVVGEPINVPPNSTDIVEIRVITESQGPDHTKLIEKKIRFNNGFTSGVLDEEKQSHGDQLMSWLKQTWLASCFIYTAVVGAGLLYHENLLQDEAGLAIFVITTMPLSMGLATAHKITQ